MNRRYNRKLNWVENWGIQLLCNCVCYIYLFYIITFSRGDHIVPNFEEIWPSKKGGKKGRPMRGMEYYLDAMENGPQLSGILF